MWLPFVQTVIPRTILEYNVAPMCPNQTCEPVEFYQVRFILDVKHSTSQVAGLRVDFHIKSRNQGRRIAKIEVEDEDG